MTMIFEQDVIDAVKMGIRDANDGGSGSHVKADGDNTYTQEEVDDIIRVTFLSLADSVCLTVADKMAGGMRSEHFKKILLEMKGW